MEEGFMNLLAEKDAQAEALLSNRYELADYLEQLDEKLLFLPTEGTALVFVPYMISIMWEYVRQSYVEQSRASMRLMVAALLALDDCWGEITVDTEASDLERENALCKEVLLQVKEEIDCYKIWSAVRGLITPKIPDWEQVL